MSHPNKTNRVAHNKTTPEQLQQKCNKFNIELLDEDYYNDRYHHKWKCTIHGIEHIAMFSKIKLSNGLKCCSYEKQHHNRLNKVLQMCEELNISLVNEYTNCEDKVEWKCNIHQESYITSATILKNGTGVLPCCKKQKALDEIKQSAAENGLEFLDSEYSHQNHKHRWLCKKCNVVNITTKAIILGGSLPNCCHIKSISGPNNPRYNHNVSDEQRELDRRSTKNKTWRQQVIKRDNCTCQCCGITIKDSKIVAHHIFSYIDNPNIRHDPDNGITLCVSCHIDFHKKYLNGNNTKEQLDEFIFDYKEQLK